MDYLVIDKFLEDHAGTYFSDDNDPMLIVFALYYKAGYVRNIVKQFKPLLMKVGYATPKVEYDIMNRAVWVVVKGSYRTFDEKMQEAFDATTEDPINITD